MYKYWITVLGAWLICLSSFATEEPTVMKSLRGSEGQLKPDSTAAIRDTSFYEDLSRSPRKFTDISNKNIITFTLDEGSPLYLKTPFSATLTFQLYYSFKNTPAAEDSLSEYQTLVINYDTASANPYTMRSYFEFDDAVSARLKIISISTTASGWDPLPALIVTNEMRRERIFTFDCEANKVQQILFTAPPAGADELQVYWNQSEGADEYDLEWAYIDQQAYNAQLYGDPGSAAFSRNLFRNNSSRVTLKNTESGYKIPLLYEKNGKLFFRVRAVQVTPSGKRTETNWSDYNSFDFVAGHQSNLNWQSVTSFAEEGKRKSVVQYFDGSLRSRQTVTKDNTTGTTVMAENFYDYQGRPVIQVLPSPTINSIIQHTPAFNQFLNTGAYYKDNYDKIISGNDLCSGAAPGLDAAKGGAAQYYSPQNPEKNIENNHLIPDAEGFPYSETRYMRDNTGRIAAQGGVGKEHRINQGHDTKYYYGTPEQNELDALFGTEAGDASHYFKNMVRDANGQYSVSYLDMHGRTVATALAGELPPGMKLDYLPSKENREITSSLINASNNIIKGLVIESSKTLVVPLKANYKFRYSLLPENVNIENCSKEDICYSCSYDLEITISDDCGNGQFGGTPYVFTGTIGSISEDCNDLPSLFTKEIPKTLEEGSYVITKKLTIRDTAIAVHSAAFMENNLCKTIQDFVDEQMTIFLEQTNNCTTPCGACMLQLGESQQAFITKFISDNGLDPNSEKSTQLAQDMYQRLSA
ncbi:MAG: hypothetical protein H3C48_15715, partial [Chitinophagaceae bacterium]|nr:hypothetical protein [Chitinophagaceae bacterium]